MKNIVAQKLQQTIIRYRDNSDLQSFIDGVQQEVSDIVLTYIVFYNLT